MRTSGRVPGLVMAVLALATLAGCKTDTTTTASTSAGGASVAAMRIENVPEVVLVTSRPRMTKTAAAEGLRDRARGRR